MAAEGAGIACTQLVYPSTVKLCPAYTPSGRPAKHPLPNRPPRSAAEMLETQRWRRITWRNGTKGPLNARFAAVRVRVADGPLNAENTRLPGEEATLVCRTWPEVVDAIRRLAIRGAPAIGIAGAMGVALAARQYAGTLCQQPPRFALVPPIRTPAGPCGSVSGTRG